MRPREVPFLGKALLLSLLLHAAAIAGLAQWDAPAPKLAAPAASVLNVALPQRPAVPLSLPPTPAQPALLLPETAPRHPSAARPVVAARQPSAPSLTASVEPQRLAGEAARQAMQQLSRELFYPPEAIERGLEGEALVLLFLDASGNAIAARIESSSGHAVLDEAAVRAARTLRTLPGSAPREALLPVRFRLK